MAWFTEHIGPKASIALVLLLIGCHEQTVRIELPHGYAGKVRIDCGTRGSGQTITVDATGHAQDAACPAKPAKLVIVRDGKVIQSVEPSKWGTTGDGLPALVEFTVQ
jgi:hypothetical protein